MMALILCIVSGCSTSKEYAEVNEVSDSENTDNNKMEICEDGPREHGHLRIEEGKLKDEKGELFQLRGMSTHVIGWYPNYINAGAMGSISVAGGNVIRIAMYTQAENGYINDAERNMNLMLQAIENARAMNLYVIVDWHILDDGDPNIHLEKAITFFLTLLHHDILTNRQYSMRYATNLTT